MRLKPESLSNCSFLNESVCSIYSFGLVLIIATLTPLKDSLIPLFLGSIVITSSLEFLTGWALEKIFRIRWWNYSKNKFNLKGYICLGFSLIWGLSATAVMKILHPIIEATVELIPTTVGWVLIAVFSVIIICDLVETIAAIRNMQKNLRALKAMAAEMHEISDRIGEGLSDRVLVIKGQADSTLERYSGLTEMRRAHKAEEQAIAEKHCAQEQVLFGGIRAKERERLAGKREGWVDEQRTHLYKIKSELSEKLTFTKRKYRRIIKAFPDIKSREYQELLDK